MILGWLSLVALLHFSHGYMDENLYQHHVQNFLNRSIDPCDDFYGHVCGANQVEAQPTILMMVNMKKFLKPYLTDLYNQTQEIVEKLKNKNVTFGSAAEKKAEIRGICGRDFSRCLQLLEHFSIQEISQEIGKIKKIDGQLRNLSLDEITDLVSNVFAELGTNPIEDARRENFVQTTEMVFHLEACYRALERNKKFRHQYIEAERVVDEMMKKLKEIMVKNFETTQWMKTHFSVKFYQELVQNITRLKFFDMDVYSEITTVNAAIFAQFKSCSELIFGWHPLEVTQCLARAYTDVITKANIHEEVYLDILQMRAEYSAYYNRVDIFFQALFLFLEDRISQLGTLGFIMAHEMSHAIFTRQQTINDLVPENLNCIKKHREQICSTVNYTCEMGNGTIEEDAPDIAGLAVILDLFEEEAKNGSLLDGNPPGYSKEQFLFYVISATLCNPQLGHKVGAGGKADEHSADKERINALFMHSEVFQQSFHCKKGDRMWREASAFCHLLGPDANRR